MRFKLTILFFLVGYYSSYAQLKKGDLLIKTSTKDTLSGLNKLPNAYIIDDEGNEFDLHYTYLNLLFSGEVNYMVYPAVVFRSYNSLLNSESFKGVAVDSILQNTNVSILLVENEDGEFKLLYKDEISGLSISDLIGEHEVQHLNGHKVNKGLTYSFDIGVRTRNLKIRQSDTIIRLHYLYKPSVETMVNYVTSVFMLDYMGERQRSSFECEECEPTIVTSNWIKLTSENDIPMVSKSNINHKLNYKLRGSWPSVSDLEGNNLFDYILTNVVYSKNKDVVKLTNEILYLQTKRTIGSDSFGLPKQIVMDSLGLKLNIYNYKEGNTYKGLISRITIDLEGKETHKKFTGQLPLGIDRADTLGSFNKWTSLSELSSAKEYTRYKLTMRYGMWEAEILYNTVSNEIAQIYIYYSSTEKLN